MNRLNTLHISYNEHNNNTFVKNTVEELAGSQKAMLNII